MEKIHKLSARAALAHRVKHGISPKDLLSSIFDGKDLFDARNSYQIILERISKDESFARDLLLLFASRLHRDLPPHCLIWLCEMLSAIINSFPEYNLVIIKLIFTFPNLILPLTSIKSLQGNNKFFSELLPLACSGPIQSSSMTTRQYYMLLVDILRRYPLNIEDNSVILLRNIPLLSGDDCVFYGAIINAFLQEMPQDVLNRIQPFLLEFIMKSKRCDRNFDCSHLIALLRDNWMVPMVFSHPIFFGESEMIRALEVTKSALLSQFIVAENPFVTNEQESVLRIATRQTDWNNMIPIQGTELILDPFLILVNNIMKISFNFRPENLDIDQAHVIFTACFLQKSVASNLKKMLVITKMFPVFAERLLLAICQLLNTCGSRNDLVTIIDCLLELSDVDEFCRERSHALIRRLISSSYHLRAVVLPQVAKELVKTKSIHLFTIICECLTPLAFSGDADKMGMAAYALCIYRLVHADSRQSHLNFAFTTLQATLSGLETGTVRESSMEVICILIESLIVLCKIRYVNPKIGNFATSFINICLAWAMVSSFREKTPLQRTLLNFAPVMSTLFPVAKTEDEIIDYSILDPGLQSFIEFVSQSSVRTLDPIGFLGAIFHFPPEYLQYAGTNPVDSLSRAHLENDQDSQNILSLWIERDIEAMPRSLFLGTSRFTAPSTGSHPSSPAASPTEDSLLISKLVAWTSNPALASAQLSRKLFMEPFVSVFPAIISLPTLSLSHWIHRVCLVKSISVYIHRMLCSVSTEQEYESLMDVGLKICDAKLTSSSTSQAAYAFLLKALLLVQSSVVGNHSHGETILALVEDFLAKSPESAAFSCFILKEMLLNEKTAAVIQHIMKLQMKLVECYPQSWAVALCFHNLDSATTSAELPGLADYLRTDMDVAMEVKSLSAPGPAIKKIEACYRIAGHLDLAGIRSPSSSETPIVILSLASALSVATDPRLTHWLVILYQRALSVAPSNPLQTKPLGRKHDLDRFDPNTVFGAVWSGIVSGWESSSPWSILKNVKRIPKLDWEKLSTPIPEFFIRAKIKLMPRSILMSFTSSFEIRSNGDVPVFVELFTVFKDDPTAQESLIEKARCSRLGVHAVSSLAPDSLASGVAISDDFISPSDPLESISKICALLSVKKPLHSFFLSPITSASILVGDAIECLFEDSKWTRLVAEKLVSNCAVGKSLLEIANHLLLAYQSTSHEHIMMVLDLFKAVLVVKCPSHQANLSLDDRVILAWSQLESDDSTICEKISKKISLIVAALPPSDPLNYL